VNPSWQAVSGAIARASSGKLPVWDECRGLYLYADPMLEKESLSITGIEIT